MEGGVEHGERFLTTPRRNPLCCKRDPVRRLAGLEPHERFELASEARFVAEPFREVREGGMRRDVVADARRDAIEERERLFHPPERGESFDRRHEEPRRARGDVDQRRFGSERIVHASEPDEDPNDARTRLGIGSRERHELLERRERGFVPAELFRECGDTCDRRRIPRMPRDERVYIGIEPPGATMGFDDRVVDFELEARIATRDPPGPLERARRVVESPGLYEAETEIPERRRFFARIASRLAGQGLEDRDRSAVLARIGVRPSESGALVAWPSPRRDPEPMLRCIEIPHRERHETALARHTAPLVAFGESLERGVVFDDRRREIATVARESRKTEMRNRCVRTKLDRRAIRFPRADEVARRTGDVSCHRRRRERLRRIGSQRGETFAEPVDSGGRSPGLAYEARDERPVGRARERQREGPLHRVVRHESSGIALRKTCRRRRDAREHEGQDEDERSAHGESIVRTRPRGQRAKLPPGSHQNPRYHRRLSMTVHTGATLDRFPGHKYLASLHFAELSLRSPRPRPATLGKMKRDAKKETLRIALVAHRDSLVDSTGTMKVDALKSEIEWLTRSADALAANAIVLPTPRELTTGQRDRDRLAAYVDALGRTSGRSIVWAPAGVWERDSAAKFAEKLGLVLAFDPLEDDAPEGAVGYARLRAMGVRSRISTGMLAAIAEKVGSAGYGDAYVAIDSPTSYRDAKSLQSMLAGRVFETEDEDEVGFDDDDEEE